MQHWKIMAVSLLLAAALTACGAETEDAGMDASVPETEALTEEVTLPEEEEAEASAQAPTEAEAIPEETELPDETSEPTDISEGETDAERPEWAVVDDAAYAKFEELIVTELIAAAQGNWDAFLECVDIDLYTEMNLYTYLELDPSLPEEELSEMRERFREYAEYDTEWAFEDLSEVLAPEYDGTILVVQIFDRSETTVPENVEIYGRFLLTVMNKDNDYQEIEGYAYSIDERKGVWLQPD